MNIDDLSQAKTLTDQHEIVLYDPAQRATRKGVLPQLVDYMLSAIEGVPDETIYSLTMDGSSFTVAILPATPGGNVWAQITLSGAAPAGAVILPGVDDRAHGQEALVTCTQAVTALTINGGGATIAGAPAALAANGFFRLRFDSVSATWYRIG